MFAAEAVGRCDDPLLVEQRCPTPQLQTGVRNLEHHEHKPGVVPCLSVPGALHHHK